MDRKELRDALEAEWEMSVEHQRQLVEHARVDVEAQIVRLDEQWMEAERKHRSAMKSSPSEAWSRSLLMVYEERRAKHEAAYMALRQRADELSIPREIARLDFAAVELHLDVIERQISEYSSTLAIKRRQGEYVGEYGNVEDEKWHGEIAKFIAKTPQIGASIKALQSVCEAAKIYFDWVAWIARCVDAMVDPAAQRPEPLRSDGVEFERACLSVLSQAGWQGSVTKATGDQGVDIIARKGSISIAIQCKDHKLPVGNGAVQEVYAGMKFYEADIAIVVCPSGFTEAAIELAGKLGVCLVDPSLLGRLEELL